MLKEGQTILLPKPGQETSHLWVNLLVPDPTTGETVIVNLTTLRGHSDRTVVLQPGEHPFVQHPTVIHYADARIVDARPIIHGIKAGSFRTHTDCSASLLKRIQKGIFSSALTPKKVKDFVGKRLSAP